MKKKFLRIALLGAFSTLAVNGACAASPDTALLEAANNTQPAVISSLKDMVLIESGSGDVAGLAQMTTYMQQRLQALGAKVERRKGSKGHAEILVARFTGTGSKRLMLLGHMDTVYEKGVLATQPVKLENGRLYGPGIADDKGGLAVILHALKILQDSGWRNYAELTVLLNGDEEIGSGGSGEFIAQIAAQQDYVFSCEPSPDKPEALLLGASGTGTVTMSVKGRAAHSGAAPEAGRNALLELSHQLLQTRDVARSVPGTQLNWTMSEAGRVRNQIPESATAFGDLRLTVGDGFEKIDAALREQTVAKLIPDTETAIKVERGRPPFIANAQSIALAQTAKSIYAELDRKLVLIPTTGGATDAGFAGSSGKALVLESFGLPGNNYHARDEYIVLDAIVPRLYLMTRMLQEAGQSK